MSERNTFNQVNQQESSAYINGTKDKPTVLIKRTAGNITVGRLDKATQQVFFSEDGVKYEKKVGLESLSDARQEQLAIELAGRALRGAVEIEPEVSPKSSVEFDENGLIKMPEWIGNNEQSQSVAEVAVQETERTPDPLDALDESVREEVLSYHRAVRNKTESEQAKNFAQAAEDGRAIYRVQQNLSPSAKAFLNLR